ncbi:MAG: sulfatase-like hydrolase/transferase [Pseudomonadota bacterium]
MKKPNVIWICTDQQRADSLACYGNPVCRSPNIDRIAATGVRFDQHHTPMQICSPSRATMATGLLPRHHQLITNGRALPENVPTLMKLLSGNGYSTHGVGKQHLQPILADEALQMPDSRSFWETRGARDWDGPFYGYDSIDLLLGESDTAAVAGHYASWLEENFPESASLLDPASAPEPPPEDLDEIWNCALPFEQHYNYWITERACRFLQSSYDDDHPYFLFVSFPDPHHPFSPPAPYCDRFKPEDMPLPRFDPGERERMPDYLDALYPKGKGFRELYWSADDSLEAGSMITTDDISDHSMQRAIAATYGMIEMIDDCVGKILSEVEKQQGLSEVLVVFTSDHGELLGTHGLLHKGPPSYRQLTQVSCLMSGPGIDCNRVVESPTNHIDLMPTLLVLCGIDATDVNLDGTDLSPVLSGHKTSIREFDFGEYHPTALPHLYNQTVRTAEWRLSVYPQRPQWGELFDLRSDPEEHVNLFNDPCYSQEKSELATVLQTQFPPQFDVENPRLCKW